MIPMINTHRLAAAALVLFGLVGLPACQIGPLDVSRPPVAADGRIPLMADGPHNGSAATQDAQFNYTYSMTSTPQLALDISGEVTGPSRKFERLTIYIRFLADEGRILDRKLLYASGNSHGHIRSRRYFEHTYDLPPDTVAMAFFSSSKELKPRR